jgi:hypothetical protein
MGIAVRMKSQSLWRGVVPSYHQAREKILIGLALSFNGHRRMPELHQASRLGAYRSPLAFHSQTNFPDRIVGEVRPFISFR